MRAPTLFLTALITASALAGCARQARIERIYPEDLYDTKSIGFAQVVTAQGGKHVFVSGTIAYDKDMNLIGRGDVEAQLRQTLRNIKLSLAAAGATVDDVVRMRIFIVDFKEQYRSFIGKVIREEFRASDKLWTSTLVGVQALALKDLLVEVDVTAVVD